MLRLAAALMLAMVVAGCGADAEPDKPVPLPELQGHYRVIAAFTDNADRAQSVVNAFKSSPGFDERDIAWFVVAPDHVASNLSNPPPRAELEKLHTVDGFQAVLVGKDGTLKASQLGGLDIQALMQDIDQMPMRIKEMMNQ